MQELTSKGMLIYTVALFSTAIASFVIAMPQHSILAGLATLAAIAIVFITALGRDVRVTAIRSEAPDS